MSSNGLNRVIGEAKRFLAYGIVGRLKKQNEEKLLQMLAEGVQEREREKGKRHQVFRLSFHAKEVKGDEIASVPDYMHYNPVSGKWNLAKDYLAYAYSSSRFYETGEKGNVAIFHFQEVVSASEFPADNSEGE